MAATRPKPLPLAYSIADAAASLSVTRMTVHNLIKAGKLRSALIGMDTNKRCRRVIPAAALAELMEQGERAAISSATI